MFSLLKQKHPNHMPLKRNKYSLKELLNHAHEGSVGILETERHGDITETPEWGDESRFDLVGSIQTDLMVP